MPNSFDPKVQESDLTSKLVVGLERLSEVFRVLLWEKAKQSGLSPIQIQILLFLQSHHASLANVSTLSLEFNLKKPTVSDAIKVLFGKGLIEKKAGGDARGYTIVLSMEGLKLAKSLQSFDDPLRAAIDTLGAEERNVLYQSLVTTIFDLNQQGIIQLQRTCFGCRFYEKMPDHHHCHFIHKDLTENEIRLDCHDYQPVG